MLALTHVSTRHPLGLLRDEARAVFTPTVVPRDFDTIEIPFAERGEPTLVRWDAAPQAAPDTHTVPGNEQAGAQAASQPTAA